jgi:hypothetical protein
VEAVVAVAIMAAAMAAIITTSGPLRLHPAAMRGN